MKGRVSVLFVVEGSETAFMSDLCAYAKRAAESDNCLYVDLYHTKHANKFLLVEMYKDKTLPHESDPLSLIFGVLLPSSRSEIIYPIYSDPPSRRRPLAEPFDVTMFGRTQYTGDALLGAFVTAHIFSNIDDDFQEAIWRMGGKVSANESGFLYADMYKTDTPQRYLMVEVYTSKATLWGHQNFQHTRDFAQEKKQYEATKTIAFTIRPAFSYGLLARVPI